MTNHFTRHIVVGGGIVGSAIAARLADRGAKVTIVDHVGGEEPASVRTLGWVNDAAPTLPEYSTLRILGKTRLLQEQGRSPRQWYGYAGRLGWADHGGRQPLPTAAVEESIPEEAARLAALGEDVYLVSPEESARIEPALDPSGINGPVLYNAGESWVDLPGLIGVLRERVVARGGGVEPRRVTELITEHDRVVGVRVAGGESIAADSVVVAAGADTPGLLATAGIDLPADTNIGVTVITEPLARPPRSLLRAPYAGARPDPEGRLVIVAGSLADRLDQRSVPAEAINEVLAHLSGFLVGHPALRVQKILVGRRPIPGGGFPVVGPLVTRAGLSVAFTHSGATIGLLIGQLLADELVGDIPSALLARFRPDRFGI